MPVKVEYKMNVQHASARTSVILFVCLGLCISRCTLAHTDTYTKNIHIGRQTEASKMIVLGRHEMRK